MVSSSDLTALEAKQTLLRCRLRDALADSSSGAGPTQVDVVITPAEVNYRHGTGALVRTMFGQGEGILSIRSIDFYDREHSFGQWSVRLDHSDSSREQVFARVKDVLGGFSPKRVFCIPYHADEVYTAIAINEVFGAPLAAHLMDDGNLFARLIPDELMREFLERCSVRFAIGPQMRDAYEAKYDLEVSICPPLVPDELVRTDAACPSVEHGVMVGNLWSERWSAWLRETIRESGRRVDWYGSRQLAMQASDQELERDGIVSRGLIAEAELARRLSDYPFAVVPTGLLDAGDDRSAIGRLSLPSRIVFTLASSNTPMIVVGSHESAAARFVTGFGIGVCCDYSAAAFRQAVERVTTSNTQAEMRARAAGLADKFSAAGIGEWLWASAARGAPVDGRFEHMFPRATLEEARDVA